MRAPHSPKVRAEPVLSLSKGSWTAAPRHHSMAVRLAKIKTATQARVQVISFFARPTPSLHTANEDRSQMCRLYSFVGLVCLRERAQDRTCDYVCGEKRISL